MLSMISVSGLSVSSSHLFAVCQISVQSHGRATRIHCDRLPESIPTELDTFSRKQAIQTLLQRRPSRAKEGHTPAHTQDRTQGRIQAHTQAHAQGRTGAHAQDLTGWKSQG